MISGSPWSWSCLFFGTGFLALTAQVLLLRDLLVSLQGDELGIGLGLAAWLAGITLGALSGKGWAERKASRWAGWLLGLLPWSALAGMQVARWGRGWLGIPAGELAGPVASGVLATGTMLAPGFLVGAVFPVLAASAVRVGWPAGRSIARLYSFEALGTFCGGTAVTLVLVPFFSPIQALCLAGGLGLAASWPAAWRGGISGKIGLIGGSLVLLMGALPPVAGPIEQVGQQARFAEVAPGMALRAWKDTPFQHLALGGEEFLSLYTGGQFAGGFPDPAEHESLAHQLACLTPDPGRVLGGASLAFGPLRFLLLHPVRHIDLIVPDRAEWDFLLHWLPEADRQALLDPRVRIVHEDPRRFLAQDGTPYDVMLFLDPVPVTLFQARLSTTEFFHQAAARLNPGGVLILRFSAGPNLLTGESAALAGSLHRTLKEAFPVVRAAPGPPPLLLAGRDSTAVTLDPGALEKRWTQRGLNSPVFVTDLIPLLFPPERVHSLERELELASAFARISNDDHPISLLYGLALRERVARNPLAHALRQAAEVPGWVAGMVVCAMAAFFLLLAVQRRGSRAAGGLLAMAGAAGMAWSLLILLSFQTTFGALYGQLGLLTALFMLGLSFGGFLGGRGLGDSPGMHRRRLLWASLGGVVMAVLLPLTLPRVSTWAGGDLHISIALHGLLLIGAGVMTGLFFPAAAGLWLACRRGVAGAAGRAQAADHLGAALSALVTAALLVPALGLAPTAWLVGAGLIFGGLGVLTARVP